MKFNTKSTIIVTALAMATTGALALNQIQADAATIATTHSGTYSSLYREDGKIISNRALAPDTPWLVGKIATINGETMYQVSTNEYLRAKDSSLNGQQTPADITNLVGTAKTQLALYNRHDGKMANRALGAGSAWQIGKVIKNKQGITFVQVSTNEYANAADMTFNQALIPTYIEDFGMGNTFDGSTSNSDNDYNINTDPNAPITDPHPEYNNSDSTISNNNNSNQSETVTPNLSEVQSAVFASINAERQSKGIAPLIQDSSLTKAATIRVEETTRKFGHTRPNGTNAQTVLAEVGNNSTYYGENLFATPWDQLSVRTPEHYAKVVMDNYRGEMSGSNTTSNHYTNLMLPSFGKVGIGVYETSDGVVYVAEEFTN
ncbi:CAP domain-containing protein [Companilactobacillus musae]|uniref:CAP domain-containing protein n=1 Tax=Companilactobacillus musae TaxID=1903258 RepID=UPI0013C37797|nr:CAP domain-containing protein [Companilactobacillus musae]